VKPQKILLLKSDGNPFGKAVWYSVIRFFRDAVVNRLQEFMHFTQMSADIAFL
jgi:hypothetical protein